MENRSLTVAVDYIYMDKLSSFIHSDCSSLLLIYILCVDKIVGTHHHHDERLRRCLAQVLDGLLL
jgi:hypothetical protein